MGDGGGRVRQRELRGSLQAFFEIRQVFRLLSGKGETDPAVLSIAGEEACLLWGSRRSARAGGGAI